MIYPGGVPSLSSPVLVESLFALQRKRNPLLEGLALEAKDWLDKQMGTKPEPRKHALPLRFFDLDAERCWLCPLPQCEVEELKYRQLSPEQRGF